MSPNLDHPPPGDRSRAPDPSAAISIRNHDPRRFHHLRLAVTRPDGEVVLEESYRLRPGETRVAGEHLDHGACEIRVELDRARVKRFERPLGAAPGRRLHIETGNGALSVTPGSY